MKKFWQPDDYNTKNIEVTNSKEKEKERSFGVSPDHCLQLWVSWIQRGQLSQQVTLLRVKIHKESNSTYKRKRTTPCISFANYGGFFPPKYSFSTKLSILHHP